MDRPKDKMERLARRCLQVLVRASMCVGCTQVAMTELGMAWETCEQVETLPIDDLKRQIERKETIGLLQFWFGDAEYRGRQRQLR